MQSESMTQLQRLRATVPKRAASLFHSSISMRRCCMVKSGRVRSIQSVGVRAVTELIHTCASGKGPSIKHTLWRIYFSSQEGGRNRRTESPWSRYGCYMSCKELGWSQWQTGPFLIGLAPVLDFRRGEGVLWWKSSQDCLSTSNR